MNKEQPLEFTPKVLGAYLHQRLTEMSPEEFRELLRRNSPDLLDEAVSPVEGERRDQSLEPVVLACQEDHEVCQ